MKKRKEKTMDKKVLQGFALAAGYCFRMNGNFNLEELLTEHNITIEMLEDAEVDEYDLEPIKDYFKGLVEIKHLGKVR